MIDYFPNASGLCADKCKSQPNTVVFVYITHEQYVELTRRQGVIGARFQPNPSAHPLAATTPCARTPLKLVSP